ncbi:hypothetical protein LCU97_03115 [Pseudomonas sp. 20TX0172]|nr:hypothetical protein [Pseudomonas uvaldensis]MCE0460420.1 hypothetical protein [Pseudomonas uvaldensis]
MSAGLRRTLARGSAVRSLDFDLGDGSRYSDFKADGQWRLTPGKAVRGLWRPAGGLDARRSLPHTDRVEHR